jgi:isocitrate dehydrogenase
VAERVHNAWLRTMEDGIHTYDIFRDDISKQKVGTKEFAQAVVARLGQKPEKLNPKTYSEHSRQTAAGSTSTRKPQTAELAGVDIFLQWDSLDANNLAARLNALGGAGLKLTVISNRGTKVWPNGAPETFCVNAFQCRFVSASGGAVAHAQVVELLGQVAASGLGFSKAECLLKFDGQRAYSVAQGE